MEKETTNEMRLFTDEEIVKVIEDFDEAMSMDRIDCVVYSVSTQDGRILSRVKGFGLNVMLCVLSILEDNGITIEDLKSFKLFKDMIEK